MFAAFCLILIVEATHHIATGPQLVADPNYNVTIEEIRAIVVETYGDYVRLDRTWFYVPFYANSLDYRLDEGITIMKVLNGITLAVDAYVPIVWA